LSHQFTGSHSDENIANMFVTLMDEWDVCTNVMGIVTDNAANMRKAFAVVASSEADVRRMNLMLMKKL